MRDQQRLIVGLGNPGDRYRHTRHNLGFRVADELARERGMSQRTLECNALVMTESDLMLAWPQTFMNRSGYSVRCLVERHGFAPSDVLVVFDDTSIPLGAIRMRQQGGPGGHRGMESVIRNLQTDAVARLRLGVAPAAESDVGSDLSEFVLGAFAQDEIEQVEQMVKRAAAASLHWLVEGAEATMSRFNG